MRRRSKPSTVSEAETDGKAADNTPTEAGVAEVAATKTASAKRAERARAKAEADARAKAEAELAAADARAKAEAELAAADARAKAEAELAAIEAERVRAAAVVEATSEAAKEWAPVEGAVVQANAAWKRSSERDRVIKISRAAALAALLPYLAMIGAVTFGDRLDLTSRQIALVLLLSALSVVVGFILVVMYFTSARVRFDQRLKSEAAEQALDRLTGRMKLVDLLQINRKQMQAYDALARGQAASSYRVAQVAITVGLLVLIGGSIVAIAAQDDTTKVTAAALTAIGGAIAGYIGRTFLRTYEKTLGQLNFYFEQPLVTSYILTAERVTKEMSDGGAKRDEIYAAIVDRIMSGLIKPLPSTGRPTEDANEK